MIRRLEPRVSESPNESLNLCESERESWHENETESVSETVYGTGRESQSDSKIIDSRTYAVLNGNSDKIVPVCIENAAQIFSTVSCTISTAVSITSRVISDNPYG